jgi:serine/threonine protein kinase
MGNVVGLECSEEKIELAQFQLHYPIGRGGFGRVWKVAHKKSGNIYAMKEMSKLRVLAKKSVKSVMNERKLLSVLKHPFLVNMQYAFQTKENLYLVMDLMSGGDLRYHMSNKRKFSERETKFIVCCLLCALEYLHVNNIIHRDVKPENLVFDSKGYLRLTDFGVSREWKPGNSSDTSGTPGYMAPEVLNKQCHTYCADYFAVGVIAYELLIGRRPYYGKNRVELREMITCKQVEIRKKDISVDCSIELMDFINKLIQRKPANRLGFNGPREVKAHAWLATVNWRDFMQKTAPAPFIPIGTDHFDEHNAIDVWEENEGFKISDKELTSLFEGYEYSAKSNKTT